MLEIQSHRKLIPPFSTLLHRTYLQHYVNVWFMHKSRLTIKMASWRATLRNEEESSVYEQRNTLAGNHIQVDSNENEDPESEDLRPQNTKMQIQNTKTKTSKQKPRPQNTKPKTQQHENEDFTTRKRRPRYSSMSETNFSLPFCFWL